MFYFAIILKLGLSVWLLLVHMSVISRQAFNCWHETLPASFSPTLAAMETHVDLELQRGAISGTDAVCKSHRYSSDYEWTERNWACQVRKRNWVRIPSTHTQESSSVTRACTPNDVGSLGLLRKSALILLPVLVNAHSWDPFVPSVASAALSTKGHWED